jgi:Predicted membrane protein (DUF2254)
MQISWKWRRRWWQARDFAGLTRRAIVGFGIAGVFVGATVAIERLLPDQGVIGGEALSAASTVLGTVVGFFAVATLAISVSLTLLQVASTYPSEVMAVFVEDNDRELLLQTIFVSFLVSLTDLFLLTERILHPLVALALPITLAFVTLMLMVGYVHHRVRLFDPRTLSDFLVERVTRTLPLLGTQDRSPALECAARDVHRLALLVKKLREDDSRWGDSIIPMRKGARLLSRIILDSDPKSYSWSRSYPYDFRAEDLLIRAHLEFQVAARNAFSIAAASHLLEAWLNEMPVLGHPHLENDEVPKYLASLIQIAKDRVAAGTEDLHQPAPCETGGETTVPRRASRSLLRVSEPCFMHGIGRQSESIRTFGLPSFPIGWERDHLPFSYEVGKAIIDVCAQLATGRRRDWERDDNGAVAKLGTTGALHQGKGVLLARKVIETGALASMDLDLQNYATQMFKPLLGDIKFQDYLLPEEIAARAAAPTKSRRPSSTTRGLLHGDARGRDGRVGLDTSRPTAALRRSPD